ncbi:Hypothetical protein, putative [Bodo saltans]|uniref:Membrane-associated protein n=1 Tax=Bodo saltans TaxID=75058 RepID=A0A0S4JBE2_BODSA|nr:Hypothetical protein, putative [Bodo saltans]|eukprot:CUG87493.1 Hypothetical protein, putative [Bodo saltans]
MFPIVQLIISMIALGCLTRSQASEFFLIADPSVSAGAGALQNCRRECAAATRGTGINSNEVINLMSSTSSSDFSLGGSRLTDGSTRYWTENKHATLLAHNSQGVPFYEGVTVTQDGHAINGAFNALCPSEPNNGGDPPTSETHIVVRYCPAGWGWNDATIHRSNGCVCRRFQSASSSYNNNFSLSYPTPSLSAVTSGTMSRSDGTGTLFSNSRSSNTPTATHKSFSSGTSQSSTCFSLSSSELLSTTIARRSNPRG